MVIIDGSKIERHQQETIIPWAFILNKILDVTSTCCTYFSARVGLALATHLKKLEECKLIILKSMIAFVHELFLADTSVRI